MGHLLHGACHMGLFTKMVTKEGSQHMTTRFENLCPHNVYFLFNNATNDLPSITESFI